MFSPIYPCISILNGVICTKGDWTPDRTPALWGRISHGGHRESENDPAKEWHEHKTQQVEISHDDRQKKWYDLDDKKKKEFEVSNIDFTVTYWGRLTDYNDLNDR